MKKKIEKEQKRKKKKKRKKTFRIIQFFLFFVVDCAILYQVLVIQCGVLKFENFCFSVIERVFSPRRNNSDSQHSQLYV